MRKSSIVGSVRTLRRRAVELCTFEYRINEGEWHTCIDTSHAYLMFQGGYTVRAIYPESNRGDKE